MNLKLIANGAFCGVREMSTLNLNYNKLTSLPPMCSLKCCLVNLHIANNDITSLSKTFVKEFQMLSRIDLNSNNLVVLPDLHWIQHSLYTINAHGNNIQSLGAFNELGTYQGSLIINTRFTRLHAVNVGFNSISTFNVSLLYDMPQLHYINLNGNKLTHISDFRSLYLRNISLRNNPWRCGVELSWMGEEDMGFEQDLICATPACRRGLAIAEMSK